MSKHLKVLRESGFVSCRTAAQRRIYRVETPAFEALARWLETGWHLCLVVAERLLDGRPIPPIRGADARNYGWDDLNEAYAKVLEIPVTEFPES